MWEFRVSVITDVSGAHLPSPHKTKDFFCVDLEYLSHLDLRKQLCWCNKRICLAIMISYHGDKKLRCTVDLQSIK